MVKGFYVNKSIVNRVGKNQTIGAEMILFVGIMVNLKSLDNAFCTQQSSINMSLIVLFLFSDSIPLLDQNLHWRFFDAIPFPVFN